VAAYAPPPRIALASAPGSSSSVTFPARARAASQPETTPPRPLATTPSDGGWGLGYAAAAARAPAERSSASWPCEYSPSLAERSPTDIPGRGVTSRSPTGANSTTAKRRAGPSPWEDQREVLACTVGASHAAHATAVTATSSVRPAVFASVVIVAASVHGR